MAIANVANTTTTYTFPTASKTINITVSGSNTALFVITNNHTSLGSITGVTATKGGTDTAMTMAMSFNNSANSTTKLWYIASPDAGSINIIATASASIGIAMGASLFSGVDQTTPIDATDTANEVTTTTSFTETMTTTNDNAFVFWGLLAQNALALTGGANTTIGSQPEASAYGTAFAYSTSAITPAGSTSLNVTSSTQPFTSLMLSIKPFVATTARKRLSLLGVG